MIQRPPLPAAVRLQVNPPRLLDRRALLAVGAYGLILAVPVVTVMLAVTTLQLGWQTFLAPLLAIGLATWFLPLGFGNPHVVRLVRSLDPAAGRRADAFVVQLTTRPRTCSGLRALLEDADDIGCLTFTESELVFHGDSLQLTVPFEKVTAARRQSIGWRGLFLYRPRLALTVAGVQQLEALEFTERSSWTLGGSRRVVRRLFQQVQNHLPMPNDETSRSPVPDR